MTVVNTTKTQLKKFWNHKINPITGWVHCTSNETAYLKLHNELKNQPGKN